MTGKNADTIFVAKPKRKMLSFNTRDMDGLPAGNLN
jgi:hypothetical protein